MHTGRAKKNKKLGLTEPADLMKGGGKEGTERKQGIT